VHVPPTRIAIISRNRKIRSPEPSLLILTNSGSVHVRQLLLIGVHTFAAPFQLQFSILLMAERSDS
jgi:hypothetical protein